MGDPDVMGAQALDLLGGQPYGVSCDLAGTEEPDLLEPIDRPPPRLRLVLVDLAAGLREVIVDEGSFLVSEVPGPEPGLPTAHVHSLGGDERTDPGVRLPSPDERAGIVERVSLLCRHLGVEDRPSEEPPDAERLDRAGDPILEVVEVEEGGGPAEEHLGDPGPGARFDVGFGPVGVHGEQGLEESRQLPVVGDPAERMHGHVRVEVYEARDDRPVVRFDDLGPFSGRIRTHVGESPGLDPEVSANDPAGGVLRHQERVAKDAGRLGRERTHE